MLWYLDGVSQEFLLLLESLFQTRGWFEVRCYGTLMASVRVLPVARVPLPDTWLV